MRSSAPKKLFCCLPCSVGGKPWAAVNDQQHRMPPSRASRQGDHWRCPRPIGGRVGFTLLTSILSTSSARDSHGIGCMVVPAALKMASATPGTPHKAIDPDSPRCPKLRPVYIASSQLMRRYGRLLTVAFALWALLFTQTAVAAYACQGALKAVQVAQMTEAGLPCAQSMSKAMDDEQTALCHAHCQSAQKTLDNHQPQPAAAPVAVAQALTIELPANPHSTGAFLQVSLLRISASPPLAISHCCFRI